jgi:hypothetical protein
VRVTKLDNQEYDDDREIETHRHQDLKTLSPIRMALRGTVLGMFLETREKRYLLSFICYAMAFILFGAVIFYVIQAITTGTILDENNHDFFGKLFIVGCWISSFVTLGAFTAQRYAVSFQAALVTAFIIFLTTVRP